MPTKSNGWRPIEAGTFTAGDWYLVGWRDAPGEPITHKERCRWTGKSFLRSKCKRLLRQPTDFYAGDRVIDFWGPRATPTNSEAA